MACVGLTACVNNYNRPTLPDPNKEVGDTWIQPMSQNCEYVWQLLCYADAFEKSDEQKKQDIIADTRWRFWYDKQDVVAPETEITAHSIFRLGNRWYVGQNNNLPYLSMKTIDTLMWKLDFYRSNEVLQESNLTYSIDTTGYAYIDGTTNGESYDYSARLYATAKHLRLKRYPHGYHLKWGFDRGELDIEVVNKISKNSVYYHFVFRDDIIYSSNSKELGKLDNK